MKNKIIFWLATGFIFLFEGLMSLGTLVFAPEYVNVGTKPLGYPDYFAYALIVCKVLGATALVIRKLHPKIREWAYAGAHVQPGFCHGKLCCYRRRLCTHHIPDGYLCYPCSILYL